MAEWSPWGLVSMRRVKGEPDRVIPLVIAPWQTTEVIRDGWCYRVRRDPLSTDGTTRLD
jgi:hypothetical protein